MKQYFSRILRSDIKCALAMLASMQKRSGNGPVLVRVIQTKDRTSLYFQKK